MFRKNYYFYGHQDCGREFHFYKIGITKKEAEIYAKYLIAQYQLKVVKYCTTGKIRRLERAT